MGIHVCDQCHKELGRFQDKLNGRHLNCELKRREKEKEYQKSLKNKVKSR